MKKTTTYWLIAATMTLAGCASDNDLANNYDGDGEAVNITATRSASTITTSTSTPLAEGETFRLINSTRQALGRTTKCDAVYVVDANGKAAPQNASNYVVWQTGIDIYGKQITENEFLAIIPADKDADSPLPTDQSSADKLKAADLQTASTTLPITSVAEGIDLTFAHQNAKLTFNVSLNDDASGITSIKVFNSIVPYFNTTANTIEAIVTPTASPVSSLIAITLADGEQLNVALPLNIAAIEKGKQYNFSLTIGHNTLTISSVSVSDWTPGNVSGKNEAWNKDDDNTDYITFTAESEQGFMIYYDSDPDEWEPDDTNAAKLYTTTRSFKPSGYEYSVNNGEWIPIGKYGIEEKDEAVKFGGDKGTLRLRGKKLSGTENYIIAFTNDTKVACTGDIRTLLDYESYKTVDTRDANFNFLFIYCKQLISAPKLPCMNLDKDCYEGMFYGCTSLVEAPALPATTLAVSCYENMFYGCTSLVEAPALPATTLANYCYESMFEDCSSLKVAPALPATELAESCYKSMFDGCSSLKVAPALPATELKSTCYAYMFDDCTSLTVTPELPATTLSPYCYNYMFSDCTSLTTAPALPATDLAKSCYSGMFSGCTALTKAPELKASILVTDCYSYIFLDCSNLSSVTMLAEDVNAETCLYLWLENAGTSAQSRTLKLKNATVYNTIINTTYYERPALPDNWKSGASGTTIIFEEQ